MIEYNIEYASIEDCEQIDSLIYSLKVYESILLNEKIDTNIDKTEDLLKKKDYIIIVAKLEDKVLGVGRGYTSGEYMFLNELFVDGDFRNLHIGKGIYYKFIELGKRKKMNSLVIPTLNDNIDSQKFYENIGAKKMYIQYEVTFNDGAN